jgi:outer membrane lipoprotein carrier protein
MWQPTAWLFTFAALNLTSPEVADVSAESPPAASYAAASDALARSTGDAKLDKVLGALQKTYEGTGDFSAGFTQKFTYTLLRRTQTSKGQVRFKKPGLMRWDYKSPTEKSFIVDGKKLWVNQPEDKNVLVDHCFKQDGLTASVSFLWGSGQIAEQFDAAWFDGVFGKKTDHHIQLTPKKPNGIFAKLILVVNPKTHRVQQSVVVDPQGNVNQFLYEKLEFNKGLDGTDFAFSAPEGTPVSRIPGSCDPAKKAG